jgi:hypothetical protein
MSVLVRLVARIARGLEGAVRRGDAWWGGTATIGAFHDRSPLAFFLPLPVVAFIIYGPSFFSVGGGPSWRGGAPAALLVAGAVALQTWYFLQPRFRWMAWLNFGTVLALGLGTLFIAADAATQAGEHLYRHYYGPFAVIAMFVAVPIAWMMHFLEIFKLPEAELQKFHRACDVTRVVSQPSHHDADGWDILSACLIALMRTPLHIVTPVAFVVLLVPAKAVLPLALVATAFSWLLFAASNYDPEQDAFVRLIRRSLLSGGSLLITLCVVVLAALRLVGFDYVETLLDAGGTPTVLSYVVSTYAVIWLYDFWVEQVSLELLGGLDKFGSDPKALAPHGSGRIVVKAGADEKAQRILEPGALLTRIAETAHREDRAVLREQALRLEQRLRAFKLACGVIFAALLGLSMLWLHFLPQFAGLSVEPESANVPPPPVNLGARLTDPKAKTALMLAASGGGTRAALYTSGILHGLHRLEKLEDLVVVSGVSGGSAALAYYATHRDELGADEERWRKMREQLSVSFIDDVLAGAGELRMVAGGRLGMLLTESFERRLGPGVPFSSVRDLGLIFNTSLCGVEDGGGGKSSEEAGGRLVITNMDSTFDHAASAPAGGWGLDLPYYVVRAPNDSVFRAAALSANFPPVFSNAAVDVNGQIRARYWVTDGGVVENRGVISILLALIEALEGLGRDSPARPITIADVAIVVADASALDPSYHSDRGVGARFGAAEQLTNRLVKELLERARALHAALSGRDDGVRVVNLPMPEAMRVAGTFGTHWMMPRTVAFRDREARAQAKAPIELSRETMLELIDAIFSAEYSLSYLRQMKPPVEHPERIYEETKNLWGDLSRVRTRSISSSSEGGAL